MKLVTPLKIAIVQSGRPQREIAAEAGMHESHLSRIVNGLHADDATWERLARVLGRRIGDIQPSNTAREAA